MTQCTVYGYCYSTATRDRLRFAIDCKNALKTFLQFVLVEQNLCFFMPFQRFEPPVTTIRLVLRCYLTAMRFVAKSYLGWMPHGIIGGITPNGISEREKQHPAPSRNQAGWSTEKHPPFVAIIA